MSQLGVAFIARGYFRSFLMNGHFQRRRQVSKGPSRIRHGDGGGILSNCVIELRLLTHACCERTNNCGGRIIEQMIVQRSGEVHLTGVKTA